MGAVQSGRSEADERAGMELLLALATARSDGDMATYDRLLAEATTEPARSLVLIDTVVRLLLNLVKERAAEAGGLREEALRLLALVVTETLEEP